jgi:prefoldin subunit 5
MDKDKFVNVIENIEHKSNKDLFETEEFLYKQHEELKTLIIDLTHKLEKIEELYEKVVKEIENRKL